ncbi:MAG: acetyl coenzyme A synthetase (ADP forming)-like protein, partial [Myxococcota bacterium]
MKYRRTGANIAGMSTVDSLKPFFQPRSVAVVGASSRTTSVGHAVLKNLSTFPGTVFAVNRKGGEILGHKAWKSLTEIAESGETPDLVVVCIPPQYIPGLIDEAGSAGTRAVIVISAGFAEMGEEGKALQDQLVVRARKHGIRIIGPNCLGVIRPSSGLDASFAATAPRPGKIALLSQSGALITGLISYAEREGFGLSAAVSLGAKSDVDDQEVLEYFAQDDETTAIAVYLEGAQNPREFFETLRRVNARKPVVCIKGGSTEGGAKAASSHTGSLAGSASAYRAAFAQAGVLEATSVGQFAAWARALAHQPPATGRRVAIVTNAGGPGVLAADAAYRAGLELATLSDETMAALNSVMPSVWSRNNPIDVIGDATPDRYAAALDIVGQAPEVDAVVVIMTVQAMTDPLGCAQAIAGASADSAWRKPLACSFIGLVGTEVGRFLDERGVPEFNTPERAVDAISALVRRGAEVLPTPLPPEADLSGEHPDPDLEQAALLVQSALDAGQSNLDLGRAREVLAAAGIRYNGSGTATDDEAAVVLAESLGYPVVVKVNSPDVVHKSDVGGVELSIPDAEGVREA